MQRSQLFPSFSFFKQFLKIIFYLTSGVYMLTPTAYYAYVAVPNGTVDFLLPFEVILTLILSGVLFAYCAKTAEGLIK